MLMCLNRASYCAARDLSFTAHRKWLCCLVSGPFDMHPGGQLEDCNECFKTRILYRSVSKEDNEAVVATTSHG